MNLLTRLTTTTALAVGVVAISSGAASATSTPTINSHNAHGNPARYAPFWRAQTSGDCVEQSARLAMDALAHRAVVSPDGIDREAVKLGLGADGGVVDGLQRVNGSVTGADLFIHYGFKAVGHFGGMSRATLEASLAKGDSVQVTLDSDVLWTGHAIGNGVFDPDHSVVVEAVNKLTRAVTLGDTGGSVTEADGSVWTTEHEVVPWSLFSKAWSASGYQAIVVSR